MGCHLCPTRKPQLAGPAKQGQAEASTAWPLESIVRLTLGMVLLSREAGHKQSGGAGSSRLAEALFSGWDSKGLRTVL